MPNPFFMSGVQFVDNLWIKDRTHFSDLKLNNENAQLSMMLSGLHNFTFNSFNTMPQMDMGMLLGTFWNNAFNQANAELSMMFANFPQMGNFQMPAFTPQAGVSTGSSARVSTTRPTAPEDMSEADKKTFEEKCDEFEALVGTYSSLTSDDMKKLGINSKDLDRIKKNFAKAESLEDLDSLIEKYNKIFENISEEKLAGFITALARDNRADNVHDCSFAKLQSLESFQKIYDHIGAGISADNIIALDTKHLGLREGTLLIENLLKLNPSKQADHESLKASVGRVIDLILIRAKDLTPEVLAAADSLKDAYKEAYMGKDKNGKETENRVITPDGKVAIVNAYKNLYIQIRIAEAVKHDKEQYETNVVSSETIPEEIKKKFVDANGDLNVNLRKSEIAVKQELQKYSNLEKVLLDDEVMAKYEAKKMNFEETLNPLVYKDQDGSFYKFEGGKFIKKDWKE